jgi:hypothetical protein
MIHGMSRGGPKHPSPLDAELASFIQGGVSVVIASSDGALEPDVVRGCGCRVSRNLRRVTVFYDRARGDGLLQDFAANGRIAVVFSQPSTHRTIQLKGVDAGTVRSAASDLALARAHREKWMEELCRLGYTREFSAAVWGPLPESLAAISFTPTAAFQQTPGPAAGQQLRRSR